MGVSPTLDDREILTREEVSDLSMLHFDRVDRVDSDVLDITQEKITNRLGVVRGGITRSAVLL